MKPMLASSDLNLHWLIPCLTTMRGMVMQGLYWGWSLPSTILQNYKMATGQHALTMYLNFEIAASLVVIHSWNWRVSLVLTLFVTWHNTIQGSGAPNINFIEKNSWNSEAYVATTIASRKRTYLGQCMANVMWPKKPLKDWLQVMSWLTAQIFLQTIKWQ